MSTYNIRKKVKWLLNERSWKVTEWHIDTIKKHISYHQFTLSHLLVNSPILRIVNVLSGSVSAILRWMLPLSVMMVKIHRQLTIPEIVSHLFLRFCSSPHKMNVHILTLMYICTALFSDKRGGKNKKIKLREYIINSIA